MASSRSKSAQTRDEDAQLRDDDAQTRDEDAAPGSAPRARPQPSLPHASTLAVASADAAMRLVGSLDATFRAAVHRALSIALDGSVESLAFVDHYLGLARDEDREPIVSLLAAGAGAYFGEIVRERVGGTWIGDGLDPRRLRLLLQPQFVHFSPADMAYEAIAGRALDPDDPRIAAGPTFDAAYHLAPTDDDDDDDDGDLDEDEEPRDDARWLQRRLAELAPVSEDHFHSLTCRFETLELMLELLAAKHAREGKQPQTLGLRDYVDILTR